MFHTLGVTAHRHYMVLHYHVSVTLVLRSKLSAMQQPPVSYQRSALESHSIITGPQPVTIGAIEERESSAPGIGTVVLWSLQYSSATVGPMLHVAAAMQLPTSARLALHVFAVTQ